VTPDGSNEPEVPADAAGEGATEAAGAVATCVGGTDVAGGVDGDADGEHAATRMAEVSVTIRRVDARCTGRC
jgi:hypothetical protein